MSNFPCCSSRRTIEKKMQSFQLECDVMLERSNNQESGKDIREDVEHIYESIIESVASNVIYNTPYDLKVDSNTTETSEQFLQGNYTKKHCVSRFQKPKKEKSLSTTTYSFTRDRSVLELSQVINESPTTEINTIICKTCRSSININEIVDVPVFVAPSANNQNLQDSLRRTLYHKDLKNLKNQRHLQKKNFRSQIEEVEGTGAIEWKIKRRSDGIRYISRIIPNKNEKVNKEWKINVANGSQCKRKHKKEIVREKIKECTKKIKTKSKSEDLLKNRFVIEKQRLKLEKASGILSVTTV
ncbi:hypothetical protein QYM36_008531 [Artemia franciscana]|uniref:Uncharacterized protein n=1 Tax=Artemia franciscana TaxID=6661 RepID=A0AA88LMM1_ARTSF|nr:hypothetical protein QYM36_008531 [Artemia franciscana]